jgi:murein DD-endopeptidase MepM/ murein hydrolase activator NlpD
MHRLVALALLLVVSCEGEADQAATLPSYVRAHVQADTLHVVVRNPVPAPVAVTWYEEGERQVRVLSRGDSTSLPPVPLAGRDSAEVVRDLRLGGSIGRPGAQPDLSARYAFPFPRGMSYAIIQAYGGSLSHDTDFSRYAIDFDLAVGDTITAARDGVVVSVLERHDRGGNDPDLRPMGNYVTLHHADGMLTQYVHLMQNGALVDVGDTVRAGQPIALSGATGFTSRPHLHFNVLRPTVGDAVSTPVRFERVDGQALRSGDRVTH